VDELSISHNALSLQNLQLKKQRSLLFGETCSLATRLHALQDYLSQGIQQMEGISQRLIRGFRIKEQILDGKLAEIEEANIAMGDPGEIKKAMIEGEAMKKVLDEMPEGHLLLRAEGDRAGPNRLMTPVRKLKGVIASMLHLR